ncbi:tetratricopeptide repeat protein [Rickettsia endosymbiont of Halotydeus destructor]|uniref:tetratricopeptide repeat protein n=1 Tax=Rickettsia endosymbiont of Halotydeus destructor TaxID=2996754 RepID=UPI003BB0937C
MSEAKSFEVFEHLMLGASQAELARLGGEGEAEKALESTNKALSLDPSNDEALLLKAIILNYLLARHTYLIYYNDIGSVNKIIKALDEILNTNPQSKSALILKVRALFDLKKHEEALNICNKLFELKPVSPVIIHIKGVVLILLGQNEEAIKLIDESILLDSAFAVWQEAKETCLNHITESRAVVHNI